MRSLRCLIKPKLSARSLLKGAWDSWRSDAPTKIGELHDTKPYVGKKHVTGELAWYYNDKAAHDTDSYVTNSRQSYLNAHPAEHHPVINAFFDRIMNMNTRHAVAGRDRIRGQAVPRARHIKMLLQNSPNVQLKVKDKNNLQFSAKRHDKAADTDVWNYGTHTGLQHSNQR